MLNPFFSVIIPTYNRGHTILRAINSVLGQSFKNLELIIIDDGSTDDTQDILNQVTDKRIRYIKQNKSGVSSARNNAAKIAKGSWLCFLDSDDEWLKDKLDLQFTYLKENPSCKILHGEEIWFRNGVRVNPKKKHYKGGGDQFERSLKLCIISPSTVCLEKESFFRLGLFDESFIVCEDYDLWLRYTSQLPVGYISKPLINKYGGHDDQLSSQYKAMDFYRVKAIVKLLKQNSLKDSQIELAKKELIIKSDILIKGYQKHNRIDQLKILKKILNAVDLSQFPRQK